MYVLSLSRHAEKLLPSTTFLHRHLSHPHIGSSSTTEKCHYERRKDKLPSLFSFKICIALIHSASSTTTSSTDGGYQFSRISNFKRVRWCNQYSENLKDLSFICLFPHIVSFICYLFNHLQKQVHTILARHHNQRSSLQFTFPSLYLGKLLSVLFSLCMIIAMVADTFTLRTILFCQPHCAPHGVCARVYCTCILVCACSSVSCLAHIYLSCSSQSFVQPSRVQNILDTIFVSWCNRQLLKR